MSVLSIYDENVPTQCDRFSDFVSIEDKLKEIGVLFERWQVGTGLEPALTDSESVLNAYANYVSNFKHQHGFQSVDVAKLDATHPDKVAMRQKFLSEHTHDEFEIRFFVEGCGLFYLHVGEKIYSVLCEQGDLISVPANVTHWFDMGENPEFTCIRFFTNPEGWVADFTGSDIGNSFPLLEQLQQELLA